MVYCTAALNYNVNENGIRDNLGLSINVEGHFRYGLLCADIKFRIIPDKFFMYLKCLNAILEHYFPPQMVFNNHRKRIYPA